MTEYFNTITSDKELGTVLFNKEYDFEDVAAKINALDGEGQEQLSKAVMRSGAGGSQISVTSSQRDYSSPHSMHFMPIMNFDINISIKFYHRFSTKLEISKSSCLIRYYISSNALLPRLFQYLSSKIFMSPSGRSTPVFLFEISPAKLPKDLANQQFTLGFKYGFSIKNFLKGKIV